MPAFFAPFPVFEVHMIPQGGRIVEFQKPNQLVNTFHRPVNLIGIGDRPKGVLATDEKCYGGGKNNFWGRSSSAP